MFIPKKSLRVPKDVKEFLRESNYIENERSKEALEDAIQAWKYAVSCKNIFTAEVLEIHRILMQRINPRIAGKIRDCGVWVGHRPCPNPASVRYLLMEWVEELNADISGLGPSKKKELCKKAHINFEHVHFAEDGNGRTGRILLNWQRVRNGLPILIIHEGKEQFAYYEWFK